MDTLMSVLSYGFGVFAYTFCGGLLIFGTIILVISGIYTAGMSVFFAAWVIAWIYHSTRKLAVAIKELFVI